MTNKRLISIVIPVYMEESLLTQAYQQLSDQLLMPLSKKYNYELIFFNDGSTDRSATVLLDIAKQNPCVRIIELS